MTLHNDTITGDFSDMSEVTGLILAGGRATRMGGEDKGLITLAGQPLVKHLADKLALQCGEVLISANRNVDAYAKLGFAVVSDSPGNIGGDFQGPLAGMLSGLKSCQSQWMITAPCDGPFLEHQYVSKMVAAREQAGADIAVAYAQDRIQPVYVLLNVNLIHSLTNFLDSGERKIDRWLATFETTEVDFSYSEEMFININTREQLEQAEALINQHH